MYMLFTVDFGIETILSIRKYGYEFTTTLSLSSSQAKGTKFTSFLAHVRNEVNLVPLACEDVSLSSLMSPFSLSCPPLSC